MNSLCEQLALTPTLHHENQLEKLRSWCQENISKEAHFSGSPQTQYQAYYQFARTFLDDFIANLPQDLSRDVSQLNHQNPIQFAARHGYDIFIKNAKITSKAINQATPFGMTPLHLSAAYGHLACVRELIIKGAVTSPINQQGQSALHSALFLPFVHEPELLRKKIEIFNQLLAANQALLKIQDRYGNSVLHEIALNDGYQALLLSILEKYPELSLIENQSGHLPIQKAILNNAIQNASKLLQVPGMSLQSDSLGNLAIHYAACYGSIDILELCYQHLQNLEIKDREGRTPLLLAAKFHHFKALSYLIAHGAHLDAKDINHQSIFDYAKEDDDLKHFLKEKGLIQNRHAP